ncbi:myb-like transcription factor family protein [Actinidia rufa]|uniref:Myb-like transcription factor family protein n=1 Tax=Actinidia rufa TaxID=165716 RepID=A0A7J0GS91_9ERIC|nr:myb-like transcription factor family protein [Actinidia rufa]
MLIRRYDPSGDVPTLAYALTGGLPPPLMPYIHAAQSKPRTQSENHKITWRWLPFTNSAREDSLRLHHWSVGIVKYTDEEYEKYLTDPMWTREETDQLLDMCEQFNLRFIVIANMFPSSRTVEELKDRYYGVSQAILIARASSPADVSRHPLIKEYNVSQEIERKRALSMVLSQTRQQARKDAEVLAKAKRRSEAHMTVKAEKVIVGPEGTEKVIVPVDAASPSSSVQFASAYVVSPSSTT